MGPLKYLFAKLRLLPRCKFTSGQPKIFGALFSAPARRRFKPLFNFFNLLQQTQKTLFDFFNLLQQTRKTLFDYIFID